MECFLLSETEKKKTNTTKLTMITIIKELNKAQILGIIIAIISSVYALINENDTLDTIAGVITAIGVSLLIFGKSQLKKPD